MRPQVPFSSPAQISYSGISWKVKAETSEDQGHPPCDNIVRPALIMWDLISEKAKRLQSLFKEITENFPTLEMDVNVQVQEGQQSDILQPHQP